MIRSGTTKGERSKKYRKKTIPVALREQVWIQKFGRVFEHTCSTPWCENNITVFDFQSGHNIPESKGGATRLDNLVPLCARCNVSMGDRYTFVEWCMLNEKQPPPPTQDKTFWSRYFNCSTDPRLK
jgi:5-methylcytosine-specific restriction endonuclease McrA